ncbi:hypothetical protein KKF34_17010 [Myxococcota bacterium]|nr:hypothetical protein [Myxococcota bacterium]MBU1381803.1 hypothetical protein [Myxococcota bacterium]MBU1498580.1 hypothetical protein [Myxococcota bacterium]
MRKEIWILFVILAIIFGTVYLFSMINRSNPSLKKSRCKAKGKFACENIITQTEMNNIEFSRKQCELLVSNMSSPDLNSLIKCFDSKVKNSLECAGEIFCHEEKIPHCLLKYQALALSEDPQKSGKGSRLLQSSCMAGNEISCRVLHDIFASSRNGKIPTQVTQTLCKSGNNRFCNLINKNLNLDSCLLGNLELCNKTSEFKDAFYAWTSCETGNSTGCRYFIQSISGISPESGYFSKSSVKGLEIPLFLCSRGDPVGCNNLGKITGNIHFSESSCILGNSEGCIAVHSDKSIDSFRLNFIMNQACKQGMHQFCN